jgi:excisionase family DNA binding protein
MTDPPAQLWPGGVLLTCRGCEIAAAALELMRRQAAGRDGGVRLGAEFAQLLAVVALGAEGCEPATVEARWRLDMPPSDRLLTVKEAAALRRVSGAAIRKAIAAGRLPARRHGSQWLVREIDVRTEHGKTRTSGDHPSRAEPGRNQRTTS